MNVFELSLCVNENKPKVKLFINKNISLEEREWNVIKEITEEYVKSVILMMGGEENG